MIVHGLFGETGANPVRARRREALFHHAKLTGRRNPENVIGFYLRRPLCSMPSRNIRTSKILPWDSRICV